MGNIIISSEQLEVLVESLKPKKTNITKLKSYLESKPKTKTNDRPKGHNTSRNS